MTGLTGDFAQLDAVIRQVNRFSTHFVPELAQQSSVDVRNLVEAEHTSGRGPDGSPWQPNKRGSFPPLTKTWRFRERWRATFGPATVRLQNDTVYGAVQNYGGWTGKNHASYIPKRQLLPETDLGPVWGPALELTADHLFRSYLDYLA